MPKRKPPKRWVYSPSKQTFSPSEAEKNAAVQAFAGLLEELRQSKVKPESVENDRSLGLYIIEIDVKWYRNFLYLYARYRDTREGVIAPYWESRTARLEYAGNDRYNLAYFRHTGQWWTTHENLSFEDAILQIGEEMLYLPF